MNSKLLTILLALGISLTGLSQKPPAVDGGKQTTCGLTGMADERIKECAKCFPKLSPKRITFSDNSNDEVVWWLFARTKHRKEIWYNGHTKTLWSKTEGSLSQVAYSACGGFNRGEVLEEFKGGWRYEWTVPTKQQIELAVDEGLFQLTPKLLPGANGFWISSDSDFSIGFLRNLKSVSIEDLPQSGVSVSRSGLCVFQFPTQDAE